MVRVACALLLLAVATCSASESRIVGGTPATVEQYPWIVQVESHLFGLWSQTCGAVVLTSRHALSAARCFSNINFLARFRRIRAGSSFRNTGGVIAGVLRATNHPSYSTFGGNDGDITVVFLQNSLTFSNTIAQASIVAQGSTVPANTPVVQAGWGITVEDIPDVRASQLQEVTVRTIDRDACAETYSSLIVPRRVTENMICAGVPNTTTGTCVGDFGGPLFFNNIVVGVISWGYGCTNNTLPTVHTDVSSYTNWIVQTAV